MVGERSHVIFGLFGNAGQRYALGFGFDDAAGAAIDEQKVVAWTGWQGVLAHGNAQASAEIHFVAVLDFPAGSLQHLVDLLTSARFRRHLARHIAMAPR